MMIYHLYTQFHVGNGCMFRIDKWVFIQEVMVSNHIYTQNSTGVIVMVSWQEQANGAHSQAVMSSQCFESHHSRAAVCQDRAALPLGSA